MYNKSWKSRPSLNLAQRFCQKFQLNEVRNIFLLLFLPTKLPTLMGELSLKVEDLYQTFHIPQILQNKKSF